ncbi:MAG TPA: beta-L-arabinofuranosidase domain-containing protein, partial [Phycisphaerae bacterium]|nr:beta-L-arabinofuranosidase domain-containing protein [Phycisphaerae bacterium]
MTMANDARHGVWRIGLVAVVAVCAAGAAAAQDRALVDTSASPHVAIRNVAIGAVRWTDGFWAERWDLCRREMLPSIQKALLDPRNSEQLVNFRVAAGLEKGTHRGTAWSDGDCYKWLEAVSLVYALTREAELGRLLDEWIDVIAKAQRPDGFLSTNAQLSAKVNPLDMPYTHQLYNMGHLLTAACVHHKATGKETFLRTARKTADFLCREFSPRPPRLVHFPWNPSVYMGLVDIYRATGERRYLELAKVLIDNRGSSPGGDHRNGGTDQTQDRVPVREE